MARLLRTDLPDDVWDRLAAEAADNGVKVGVYLRRLIIARDRKRHGARPSSTGSSNKKGK